MSTGLKPEQQGQAPPKLRVEWGVLEFPFGLDSLKPFLSDEGKEFIFHLPHDEQRRIGKWWKRHRPPTREEIEQYIKEHRP